MGKTVEPYRIALEQEISRWNGFARALRKEDLEAFEELMDMCRSFASESSNANTPFIFEPMVMSILLFHQKRINELEKNCTATNQCWASLSRKTPKKTSIRPQNSSKKPFSEGFLAGWQSWSNFKRVG
jgi:hypothetical protein